jgi:hypothetical protein
MKEVERIFTVEITCIEKVDDDLENLMPKEEAEEKLKKALEEKFDVTHINMEKVQDFIRDVKKESEV